MAPRHTLVLLAATLAACARTTSAHRSDRSPLPKADARCAVDKLPGLEQSQFPSGDIAFVLPESERFAQHVRAIAKYSADGYLAGPPVTALPDPAAMRSPCVTGARAM